MENEATPDETAGVAIGVFPSRKVTVPLIPGPPVTVAVRVTLVPTVDGSADEVTAVTVAAGTTCCVTALETLGLLLSSPR